MPSGPPKRTSTDHDLLAAGNPTVLALARHRFARRGDLSLCSRLRHRRFWSPIRRHTPCDGRSHGARRDGADAPADRRTGVAGQAAFMAIGAYVAAILARDQGVPSILALLAGVAASAVAGMVVLAITLRLNG